MHWMRWLTGGWALLVAGSFASALPPPTYNNVVFGTGTLANGSTVPLKMDIYRPSGAVGATPIVMWIHEGGWENGSFESIPSYVDPLLSRGITVASVEYRLSGQNIFPAQIHDVKGATRFLKANASTYGIDPLRMGAWGWSAGGHLAALLGTSGGVAAAEGNIGGNLNQSSRVLAVGDFSGPTDILNLAPDVTTPPGCWYNHDAQDSPGSKLIGFTGTGKGMGVLRANKNNPSSPYPQKMAVVNLANPITHVTSDDAITFIGHGTNDDIVPIKQSTRLRDALNAAQVKQTTMLVTADHINLGSTVNSAAIQFFATELNRYFGDANRDGKTDVRDLTIMLDHWMEPGGWAQGDFNSDGFVDRADLGLMARDWQAGVGVLGDALEAAGFSPDVVPEPAGLGGIILITLLSRRAPRGRPEQRI